MTALDRSSIPIDTASVFLRGTSVCFGLWLIQLGSAKWLGGPFEYLRSIQITFQGTPLPEPVLAIFAWLILTAEPAIGIWLLMRKRLRKAWITTGALMFTYVFGFTLLGNIPEASRCWPFVVLAFACAGLAGAEQVPNKQ